MKPKLLLHVCCWPDVTVPILDLKEHYDILCFWYDPNIAPIAEYTKRLEAFKQVCAIENIPYIIGEYDVGNFMKAVKGHEDDEERWDRCTICYDLRLKKSAEKAKELGIELFTTSLNISPKKCIEKLFYLGEKYAKEYAIEFLPIEFRKNDGFGRSVEYTKKHNIYRQDYCGCVFSLRSGGASARERYKKEIDALQKKSPTE